MAALRMNVSCNILEIVSIPTVYCITPLPTDERSASKRADTITHTRHDELTDRVVSREYTDGIQYGGEDITVNPQQLRVFFRLSLASKFLSFFPVLPVSFTPYLS